MPLDRVPGQHFDARGITDQDLVGKNASFTNPVEFANRIVAHDRVVSF